MRRITKITFFDFAGIFISVSLQLKGMSADIGMTLAGSKAVYLLVQEGGRPETAQIMYFTILALSLTQFALRITRASYTN